MMFRSSRQAMAAATAALLLVTAPIVAPAQAQQWGGQHRPHGFAGWDRGPGRHDRGRHSGDRAAAVAAGVVGAAFLGGVIAAAANRRTEEYPNRPAYCTARYGNDDERSDSYQAPTDAGIDARDVVIAGRRSSGYVKP